MSFTQKIIIGVVGVILLGLFVIGFVAGAAAVYGWRAAKRAGNEAATQANLKTIAAVEIQYYETHNRTFGTFPQLIEEEMLSSKFARTPPICDGYILTLNVTPKTSGQPAWYSLSADPQSDATGTVHFYLDSTSTSIHANSNKPAGPMDRSP